LRDARNAVRSCIKAGVDSIVVVTRLTWGFTRQVDDGWKAVPEEYVLFLNDDCEISKENLKALLLPFGDPSVGIVGPTIRCGDYQSNPTAAEIPLKDGNQPLYIEVRHLIGACLLVRRSMLEQIGGWDTDFVLHCSDLDLCIRAWAAGYKVIWAVQTVVGHEDHVTLDLMPQELRDEIVKKDEELYLTKHPYEQHGADGGPLAKRGYGQAVYALTPPKAGTTERSRQCQQEALTDAK
jgi:hypothetical protein